MATEEPPSKSRRGKPLTRPVTLRLDIELWARVVHHAPTQRRSAGNLLQKLVAEGLDRLDEDERVRELVHNAHELLAHLQPHQLDAALAWQREQLKHARRGKPLERFPPPPPIGRGKPPPPRQRPRR